MGKILGRREKTVRNAGGRLLRQTILNHIPFDLYAILGGIDRQGFAVCVDIVAVLAILNKTERIVFLDLLNRAAGRIVIVFQSGVGESTYTNEFLVSIIHLALGEGDRRAGDE